jgi:zinc transporter
MEKLVALVLDGAGGCRRLDREALRRWTVGDGALWVEADPSDKDARRWLEEESGLPRGDVETLERPVRQTHAVIIDSGELLVAQRVFAAGTGEARVLRFLASADRLVVVTGDPFPAFDACRRSLERLRGPRTIGELMLTALHVAVEDDQGAVFDLDQEVSDLEGSALRDLGHSLERLREISQRGSALRRRLGSEREALAHIKQKGPPWLLSARPDLLRDMLSSSTEQLDTVDAALDRLRGLQDYAQNRLSSVLGDRLYLLTILSAIMMPLSFVTGLLGVNVSGIPGHNKSWAFAALCVLLALLGVAEYLLLRRLRWVAPGSVARSSPSG